MSSSLSRDRYIVWDFDGTLARRPGNWTAVICDVVAVARPDLGLNPDRLRPHLQSGFPWHTPDVVRAPCSADEWWSSLLPVLATAVERASGVAASEARRLVAGVRSAYTDANGWQVFDDVRPALERLRDRGWTHIVLSNHVPELSSLIETLGLNDVISAVHCSACTGVEKPNPRAFETVFADYPGARAGWMVGDSWAADVRGAVAVGMRAILVRSKHAGAAIQCDTLHDVVDVVDGGEPRR
jgi:putative hydrolase of the HAD superfamily